MIEGHRQGVAHAAIPMDADHLYPLAAIAAPMATGAALTAMQIGNYVGTLSDQFGVILTTHLDDLAGQFMAEYPGVAEVWLIATIGVNIGATHADAANTQQRFSLATARGVALFKGHVTRFSAYDGSHLGLLDQRWSATTVWCCSPSPSMPRRMRWPGLR